VALSRLKALTLVLRTGNPKKKRGGSGAKLDGAVPSRGRAPRCSTHLGAIAPNPGFQLRKRVVQTFCYYSLYGPGTRRRFLRTAFSPQKRDSSVPALSGTPNSSKMCRTMRAAPSVSEPVRSGPARACEGVSSLKSEVGRIGGLDAGLCSVDTSHLQLDTAAEPPSRVAPNGADAQGQLCETKPISGDPNTGQPAAGGVLPSRSAQTDSAKQSQFVANCLPDHGLRAGGTLGTAIS
jgi:hypothetical protein